jgi:hypothetical protein
MKKDKELESLKEKKWKEEARKELIEEIIGKAIHHINGFWVNDLTERCNGKYTDFVDIRLKKEDWDKLKEKK